NVPGYGVNQNGANHLVALSYTRVISPRTLNEARFGFNRSDISLVTQPGPKGADYGFNTGWAANAPLSLGNIPQLAFAGGFVGGTHRNFRTSSYGLFAQDSFKVRHNVTLNYGLRYELNTVLHEAHGRLSSWRPQNFTTFLNPTDPTIQNNLAALEASGIVTQD